MYAPKFKSWLTDDERFGMALDYRIDRMVESAKAEIHAMHDDAVRALCPKPPTTPDQAIMNAYLQQMAGMQNSNNPMISYYGGQRLGSPLSDLAGSVLGDFATGWRV